MVNSSALQSSPSEKMSEVVPDYQYLKNLVHTKQRMLYFDIEIVSRFCLKPKVMGGQIQKEEVKMTSTDKTLN